MGPRVLSFMRCIVSVQVVPATVVDLLQRIAALQAGAGPAARSPPARLPKDELKTYADVERRRALAALVHRVAAQAQGIRAMER